MYCIGSRGQPTRGGPLAMGLGEVLTTPHRKNVSYYESLTRKPRTNNCILLKIFRQIS